jgi:uncharacterized protein YxjI
MRCSSIIYFLFALQISQCAISVAYAERLDRNDRSVQKLLKEEGVTFEKIEAMNWQLDAIGEDVHDLRNSLTSFENKYNIREKIGSVAFEKEYNVTVAKFENLIFKNYGYLQAVLNQCGNNSKLEEIRSNLNKSFQALPVLRTDTLYKKDERNSAIDKYKLEMEMLIGNGKSDPMCDNNQEKYVNFVNLLKASKFFDDGRKTIVSK